MKRNCVNKSKEEKRRVGRCREREEGAWRRGGMNQEWKWEIFKR
jgi:hypothetical protein